MLVRAEQWTDPVAYHGEGPVWSESWGGLRWLDMLAGDLLTLRNDGSVHRRHVASVVAAVRPRRGGGAVLGVERGFALEEEDGRITFLGELWADKGIRMNEGGCDPAGRFYCGSMAYDQRRGAGSLFRLDPDRTVDVALIGVTISNGLDWSPEGDVAYYVDTATRRIDSFDYSTGSSLGARRPFVDLAGEGLLPDGLTVDREGGVWVALANGGAVRRYRPDGRLDAVVEVAARKVTACTFGGAALDRLFITTSREGLDPGEDPLAGSLFAVETGPIGLPVRGFGG
ncbi:MAG TPA: SMP-30/gluconolactonase/LRE family protein [Longimicrobiales bacterium]|nr:SMP-30/gluconolactonase/LRE family protein [Longimicrobiales bacterium]